MPCTSVKNFLPITTKLERPAVAKIEAIAAARGVTRHRILLACFDAGLAIVEARLGIVPPDAQPKE